MSRLTIKLTNGDVVNLGGADFSQFNDAWQDAMVRNYPLGINGIDGSMTVHPSHIVSVTKVVE